MELTENDYIHLMKTYNNLTEYNNNQKRQGIHDYSLMNALLKKTDEINLHSNFIYSMINPKGSHYCGNKFLEFFLESIGESGFINLDRAQVHKEKGKIDLLIEDGEKVIIIENKLRADDQKHQISRYIQYTIENYLEGDKENLKDKIHIIYLSEYKLIPSIRYNSLVGFTLKDNKLIYNKIDDVLKLDLPHNTMIDFNRVKHSDKLYNWVIKSKEYLTHKPNSEMLIYAFEEYRLILERLKNNNWRNVMSLDEYVLKIDDIKEEEKMYEFMMESTRKLNDYRAKKLFRTIDRLVKKNNRIIELKPKNKFKNKYANAVKKEFIESNCIQWFNKEKIKKKWSNVGFLFECNNKEYFLLLGVRWIYFDKCNATDAECEKSRYSREEIFELINKFKNL